MLFLTSSVGFSQNKDVPVPSINQFSVNPLQMDVGPIAIGLWEISTSDPTTVKSLKKSFEVLREEDDIYHVHVPANQINILKSIAPDAVMLTSDIATELRIKMQEDTDEIYRDINKAYLSMIELEKKYPDLIKIYEYGQSAGLVSRGVKISRLIALKFSDNVEREENEPNLMFTAATHGDEKVTTEAMLRYMERLIQKYKNGDAEAKALIDQNELFFIPIANPDGYRNHTRFIADGTDPNRSYPFVNAPGRNSNKAKCIDELIKFFETRKFKGTIDFHAFGELVLMPYADTRERIQDYSSYRQLADMMNPGRYQVTQISHNLGIGVVEGSSVDYWYSKGAMAFSIELARSKTPFSNEIVEDVTDEVEHIIKTFVRNFR